MTQEIWVHFTDEQLLEYYQKLPDPDAAAEFLAKVLNLTEYRFIAREAIQVDFASYILEFAKEQGYGPVRTATLFNIAQQIFRACTGGASHEKCESDLKSILISRCSHQPGADSGNFSPDQVARVGRYLAGTLFRHFRLYQFVFTQEQGHTEYTAELLVETPVIQSFEAALSEDAWHQYHESRRAEAEAAARAAEEAESERVAEEARVAEEQEKADAIARRQAELARKPATLDEAIQHAVAVRLEDEKTALAAQYAAREAELLSKLATLQAGQKPMSASGPVRK